VGGSGQQSGARTPTVKRHERIQKLNREDKQELSSMLTIDIAHERIWPRSGRGTIDKDASARATKKATERVCAAFEPVLSGGLYAFAKKSSTRSKNSYCQANDQQYEYHQRLDVCIHIRNLESELDAAGTRST